LTSNKWRLVLGLAIPMVIVVASLFRSLGFFIHDIYWIQEYLGGDKATHVWMGMAMMFSGLLLVPSSNQGKRTLIIFMVVIFLLGCEELSQLWMNTRKFSFQDFAMGFMGAAIVWVLAITFAMFAAGKIANDEDIQDLD